MARQFNQIPPICEQAEYHMFQREKVEVQLPELFHKIGERQRSIRRWSKERLAFMFVAVAGRELKGLSELDGRRLSFIAGKLPKAQRAAIKGIY